MDEKTTNQVEQLLSLIFQAGGKVRLDSGRLLVSPAGIALRFSDQIRRHKPDLIEALNREPLNAKLSSLKNGLCPECDYKLDLQSLKYGKVWWCSSCRKHFKENES